MALPEIEDGEPVGKPVKDDVHVYSIGSKCTSDRVFLSVDIFNCSFVCLFDSGADISLVSQSTLERINSSLESPLSIDSSKSVAFKALGPGQLFASLGIVIVDIRIDNFIASNFALHVVEDSVTSHDMILGVDFMSLHYLAPSPAHKRLIYWPPEVRSPTFVGTNVSFRKQVVLDSTLVLQPNSVCFIEVRKPDGTGRECLFEPEVELLEKQVAFSRCLVDLSSDYVTLEVLCLSPVAVELKKDLVVGSLWKTEEVEMLEVNEQTNNKTISDLFNLDTTKLTIDQRAQVEEMLTRNEGVIGYSKDDVGLLETGSHTIELIDPMHEPIKIPPRRLQGRAKRDVTSEIERLNDAGIVEPSDSPWSAPVVPIYKPDGSVRLCIDYRALNKITLKDAYPIPNLEDTLYNLHDVQYFSSLDLMRGYYQVPMSPESKPFTSFVTSSGQWQFRRMPFGLCNAPATFQRLMNTILSRFPVERVMVYLDDVLVIGNTFAEHLDTLDQVLNCLREHGLKVNPSKCQLFQSSVKFLGHIVSSEGLSPLPENIEAIVNFKAPKSIKSVQRFLGMINFYRRFIPNCSVISKPISSLLSSKNLVWTDHCQRAFETLKSKLVNPPILGFPDFKSSEPLCLYTDASQFGAGAYLSQKQNGEDRVIAYLSTTFNQAEIQYSVLDKELAAIRWAVRRLKPFLWGRHFVIYSDHKPLSYLQGMRLLDGRLARTLEELGDYDFEVRYIPGHLNTVADALSRDSLSVPVALTVSSDYLLANFHEFNVQSGADTLFRCFALYWLGTEDEHSYVRSLVFDNLLNHPQKYHLTLDKTIRKQLRLMRLPGTLPFFESIQAFSNIIEAPVYLYEEAFGLVKYAPEYVGNRAPCYIRSYDGVCFSFLIPNTSEFDLNNLDQTVTLVDLGNAIPEVGAEKILYPLAADRSPSTCGVAVLKSLEELAAPEICYLKTRSVNALELTSPKSCDTNASTTESKPNKIVTISSENPIIHLFESDSSDIPPDSNVGPLDCNVSPNPSLLPAWRELFDLNTLRDWQKKSEPLRKLYKCIIARDKCNPKSTHICRHRSKHNAYRSHFDAIRCDSSGLLVKELKLDHLLDPVLPYLVPLIAASDLVKLAHENNAHVGRDKLYYLVQPYIFHPKLRTIVADVTRTCEHCLRMKPYSVNPPPSVIRIQSEKPFEKVHIDVLQLPHSSFGHKYVLNAVDQYSKWLASQPLREKSARTVSTAFSRILSGLPSLPDTVVSDNGGEFTGEPFQDLLKQYNIKHIFTTPYSPQSNGLVERVNRTLLGLLSGLCSPNSWSGSLGKAVITYNNTYHSEIKRTPSECLTGLVSKLPVQSRKKPFWKSGSEKFKPFAIDSLVGYKNVTRSGVQHKLTERYRGPYKVVRVNSNQKTYVIALKRDPSQEIRAHHNQLRPWFNAPAYLQQSSMFLSDSTGDTTTPRPEPVTSKFIPGLRELNPSTAPLLETPYEDQNPMLVPEVIPGLRSFEFPPQSNLDIVVTQQIPISCSGIVAPVSVAPTMQSHVIRTSSPVTTSVSVAPVFSSSLHVSPVVPLPLSSLGGVEPLSPVRNPIASLTDCAPQQAYHSGTGSTEDSNLWVSLSDSFSGFNESDSASSFSGFASENPRCSTPRRRQDPSVSSESLESVFDSPHGSMHSFHEQSTEPPAMSDAAIALRQLFPVRLSPPEATFVSDSELPSLDSDVQSSPEHIPETRLSVERLTPPRRITRSVRTQIFPDLRPEEALRRLNFET